jgi:hypothetical protein
MVHLLAKRLFNSSGQGGTHSPRSSFDSHHHMFKYVTNWRCPCGSLFPHPDLREPVNQLMILNPGPRVFTVWISANPLLFFGPQFSHLSGGTDNNGHLWTCEAQIHNYLEASCVCLAHSQQAASNSDCLLSAPVLSLVILAALPFVELLPILARHWGPWEGNA